MPLFPVRNGRPRTTAPVRRRVMVIEEPVSLAPFLRDLQPRSLCHNPEHMLPRELRITSSPATSRGNGHRDSYSPGLSDGSTAKAVRTCLIQSPCLPRSSAPKVPTTWTVAMRRRNSISTANPIPTAKPRPRYSPLLRSGLNG